ncbi:MAG: amidohydrolase family protein [Acidobacteria bacterium]|nr:amidohydrolase family protein [Acidobacteriota bacterium]
MRKRIFGTFLFVLLGLHAVQAQQGAETVLYNAKVLTVDSQFTVAEAVAIRDGKFIAVGETAEILKLAGPNTIKLDLKGKTVIPGLVHTHFHTHLQAEDDYGAEVGNEKLKMFPINFRIVKTKEDVISQIQNVMNAFKFKPGEWVFFSLTPLSIEQMNLLWEGMSRYDLDQATPDNPIALSLGVPSNSGMFVNSKGIEVLWSKYGDFIEKYGRYWVGADGKPDGHLEPPAGRLAYPLLPPPDPRDLADIYRKQLEDMTLQGITTVSTRLPDYSVEIYKLVDARGQMPVRFAYGLQDTFDTPDMNRLKGIKIGQGSDKLWLISVTSGMVDGAGFGWCTDLKRNDKGVTNSPSFGALGMDASNPQAEWYPKGWCHLDIEFRGGPKGKGAPLKGNYFPEWFGEVAANGLRSANTHVGGDASHRQLLTMWEQIDAAKPGAVKGWAMDHCNLVNPKDISRAARLGVMFSCAIGVGGAGNIAKVFGEEAAHNFIAPVKSMLDAGINVSLEGSLWPSLEALITRKDREGKVWGAHERLDRATALRVVTNGGSRYVLKEKEVGSIEVGKYADLAILDRDYLTIPESDISEIQVLVTAMGGRFRFVHPDFANENNFRPAGALILTREQIAQRHQKFESSALGNRG